MCSRTERCPPGCCPVRLTEAKGGVSKVTKTGIAVSNGVTHVTDTVLMPK